MIYNEENTKVASETILDVQFSITNIHYLRMWKKQLAMLEKFDRRKPWSMIITGFTFMLFSSLALSFVTFNYESMLQRMFMLLLVLSFFALTYNIYLLLLLQIRKRKLRRDIAQVCASLEENLSFNYSFIKTGIKEESSVRTSLYSWNDFKMIRMNKNYVFFKLRNSLKDGGNNHFLDLLIPMKYITSKDLLYELLYKEARTSGVKVHFDYY